jgi:hypothetical protein
MANIQTPSSPAFDLQAIGRIFRPNGDTRNCKYTTHTSKLVNFYENKKQNTKMKINVPLSTCCTPETTVKTFFSFLLKEEE